MDYGFINELKVGIMIESGVHFFLKKTIHSPAYLP
jgi:hypothetical protein